MNTNNKSRKRIGKSFKNESNWFLRLALLLSLLSIFEKNIEPAYFLWIVVIAAFIGIFLLIYKLCNNLHLELFDILGFLFPIIFAIGIIVMPFSDMLLILFAPALFLSMWLCLVYCKDEDAKAIAMLHVTYIFSCNLVMPCIGPSI